MQHDDGRVTPKSEPLCFRIIFKNKHDLEQKMGSDKDAMSEFRSALGSVQWLARTTRPDVAADTSLIQKGDNALTYGDLRLRQM